jgi:geranyl-CoA carboxylase beta subunit
MTRWRRITARAVPVPIAPGSTRRARIVESFERQAFAPCTSGRLLDDGVIEPRETHRLRAHVPALLRRAQRVTACVVAFGVARP